MSYELKNGALVSTKKLPRGVSAPTPGEIAERAYDLAIADALVHVALNPAVSAESVKAFMQEKKTISLAALRDSVINPGAIPWWKK